jgi:hypothetical protein
MSSTATRRVGILAVTATISAAMAAGTAQAATPQHTSLSIRSVQSTINAGGHDTISGSLYSAGHGISGQTVALLARPASQSSYHQVGHKTTGRSGGVSFLVSPTSRTYYELVFRAANGYAGSHSGVVTVNVRPDTRPPTSLSIRAAKSSINPGGKDTISGVLLTRKTPLEGRDVILQSHPSGSTAWKNAATKKTGKHGYVAFTVTPPTTTAYRLVFTSHPNYRGSHSGVVTVHVRIPTTLTLVAASMSIEPGSSDVLTGKLTTSSGPIAGRTVTLQSKPSGSSTWSNATSATTDSNGAITFTVTPAQTTAYRLVHSATATLTAAQSQPVTVIVRKASSLSIRAATGSVAPGGSDTISGTLLGQGGAALGGRTVSLMGRSAGSTDPFTLITTATTDAHGFVSFTVTPASSTDYELVFNGGDEYDGCHSGVVTVAVV